ADQRDLAWHYYDALCRRAGAQLLSAQGNGVPCVAFGPDAGLLASGGGQGTVRLWDTLTRNERTLLPVQTKRTYALAWNAGGTLLASAGADGTIVVYRVAARDRTAILKGHLGGVVGLAWHADGRTLASAGEDGTVRLWDISTGKEQARWTADTTLLALAWNK